MRLAWRNGSDLVEGELLGQGKRSSIGHLTVRLRTDRRGSTG